MTSTLMSRVVKAGDVVAVQVEEQAAVAAAAQLAGERERLRAQAFAEGLAAGKAQARVEGLAAQERAGAAVERLAEQAGRLHAEQVSATSRAVLAAAVDVAEWVLRHELPESGHSLLSRLAVAADALLPSPTTHVLVSPQDEPAVREWVARRRGVELVVDPALDAGDARYETDAGSVDVSLAAALRVAAEALGVHRTGGAPA